MRTDLKVTYAEYRALPENGPQCQLIGGNLVMSPAPNLRHQVVLGRLFAALYNHVEARSLGKVLCAPLDLILSDENVLQPDVVYVSPARRRILVPEGLRGAPDLCVEILSAKSRELDLGLKRILYARQGCAEYWVVDPEQDAVQVFLFGPRLPGRQTGGRSTCKRLAGADDLATSLLPGFRYSLTALFAP